MIAQDWLLAVGIAHGIAAIAVVLWAARRAFGRELPVERAEQPQDGTDGEGR